MLPLTSLQLHFCITHLLCCTVLRRQVNPTQSYHIKDQSSHPLQIESRIRYNDEEASELKQFNGTVVYRPDINISNRDSLVWSGLVHPYDTNTQCTRLGFRIGGLNSMSLLFVCQTARSPDIESTFELDMVAQSGISVSTDRCTYGGNIRQEGEQIHSAAQHPFQYKFVLIYKLVQIACFLFISSSFLQFSVPNTVCLYNVLIFSHLNNTLELFTL